MHVRLSASLARIVQSTECCRNDSLALCWSCLTARIYDISSGFAIVGGRSAIPTGILGMRLESRDRSLGTLPAVVCVSP